MYQEGNAGRKYLLIQRSYCGRSLPDFCRSDDDVSSMPTGWQICRGAASASGIFYLLPETGHSHPAVRMQSSGRQSVPLELFAVPWQG
jgi:hypothetical protein